MDRSLHFNVKSFFVMIEFKVCIVWHEYCYSSFLLISICMVRADSFEKTLMLGKIEGRRRRGWQRMRWLDGITDLMDMGLGRLWNWWWTGRPGMLRFMGSQRVGHDWATELNYMVWFYHTLTFSQHVSLDLKLVSCRQHIFGSCFCVCLASPCLLLDPFSPLIFSVIVDIYVPIVILLFWFTFGGCFVFFSFLFCFLHLWFCN